MDAAGFLETRFRDSAEDVLLHALDGRHYSYGQYWANARAIAETWRKAGVPRGAAIAFLLPNGPSVLACYLACAIGGHVACPIIPSHGRSVVEAMLRLIAPALVVRDAPPFASARRRSRRNINNANSGSTYIGIDRVNVARLNTMPASA